LLAKRRCAFERRWHDDDMIRYVQRGELVYVLYGIIQQYKEAFSIIMVKTVSFSLVGIFFKMLAGD
jgi:hypothetical protein